MKVGLYDVDSKIPNLALMKISAYHKARGDEVELYSPIAAANYGKVYASKIFDFSPSDYLNPDTMEIGGTGYDIKSELSRQVQAYKPDYTLYNYPDNIGFTMRGCRLKCSFCVVPKKEGSPKTASTIHALWQQRNSDKLMLLDNDFFGNPQWADRMAELRETGLKVNFNQGLNIRNLKPVQARDLARVNFRNPSFKSKQVAFAWDDPRHEKLIHKGIQTCIDAGIKPYQMMFYVLIGYHSTEDEDLHRVKILREYGCDPYVMPYNKFDTYQKWFTRWVNHKAIFKTVPWGDYKQGVKTPQKNDDQLPMWVAV